MKNITLCFLVLLNSLSLLAADISSKVSGNWSNPATWVSNVVPGSNDNVTINNGNTILLDMDVSVNNITVNGSLVADQTKDLTLTTAWIMVHGQFTWGTPNNPYTKKGKIILTGTNTTENNMGMGTKLIGTMGGGILNIHGKVKKSWTMLNASANAGSTSITLKDAVDWQPGDEFIITSTNLDKPENYGGNTSEAEKRVVASVSADGKTVSFTQPLAYDHYGKLQTFSNGTNTWVLDERAEVGLLSRNIVIQGDDASEAIQFGGHIMTMSGCEAYISGVELYRMGQAGILGRYPFHWHMAGDVSGQFIKNSSIHHSFNRAITVHGTQSALVTDNVCYDIKGHGIFLEDGYEFNNTISYNLVAFVRRPDPDKLLRPSEGLKGGDLGARVSSPGGIWISNPNNDVIGNAVSSAGAGIWYGPPGNHPVGPSYLNNPNYNPSVQPFGRIDSNRTHSCSSGFAADFGDEMASDNAADIENFVNNQVNLWPQAGYKLTNHTSFDCIRTLWFRGGDLTFDHFMTSNPQSDQGGIVHTFTGHYTNGLVVGHTEKTKDPNMVSFGGGIYDGNMHFENCHFEKFEGDNQAGFTMIGGNGKFLPVPLINCTRKNARAMLLMKYGGGVEMNTNCSVLWDKTGQYLGKPNSWCVVGHPYIMDSTFTPADNGPNFHGWITDNKEFAHLRFMVYGSGQSTKSTLYSDWSNSSSAHNRPVGGNWEFPVVVNSNRMYRFRWTDYVPRGFTVSYGSARPGDKFRFYFEGWPSLPNITSSSQGGYNNGTGITRVNSMAEFNAATGNVYYWDGANCYFQLVARYGIDETFSENLDISSPTGADIIQLPTIPSRPYKGKYAQVGKLTQAESFDAGGQNVAYNKPIVFDHLGPNAVPWQFVSLDHLDIRWGDLMDLMKASANSDNYFITGTAKDEWVQYSFINPNAGNFNVSLGVGNGSNANPTRQNNSGQYGLGVYIDGNLVENLTYGNTNGIITVQSKNFDLNAGNHVLRLVFNTNAVEVDWWQIKPSNPGGPFNVNITSPTPNQVAGGALNLTATANNPAVGTANGSGVSQVTFTVSKNDTVVFTATDNAVPYTVVMNTPAYKSGLYLLSVTASNGSQSTTVQTVFSINNIPLDITPYTNINNGSWQQTDSANVCEGSTVLFGPQPLVDAGWAWSGPNGYTSNVRQIELANLTSAMSGTYIATFTSAQGSGSHKFTLTVSSDSPSISISAPLNPVCPGSTFTLTASVSNGGSLPSFTWYRNGAATTATGNTYSFAFNNGDVVYATMKAGGVLPGCLSANTATSNTLTLATSPAACPVITPYTYTNNGPWQQTDSASVCVGSSVMFGPHPNVDAGWSWTGPNGYTSTARQIGLANVTSAMSGTYIATFTNSQGSGSHKFTLRVSSVSPSISISAPLNPVCPGSTFTLTASVSNGGSSPTFTWYKNGVATITGNTYSFAFNNGDVVYATIKAGGTLPGCLSANTATSNTLTLATSPAACPVITPYTYINNGPWQQTDSANVCVGSSVMFGPQPLVDAGWSWTGPNGYTSSARQIGLANVTAAMSGTYIATYTSAQGSGSHKFTLTVSSASPNISISAPLNPICPGSIFTLTASVSNGGSLPSFTWYRNGAATTATGNTYSFAFNSGDVVYATMKAGGVLPACLSANTANSNTLTLATSPAACPVITPYTYINNGPWQQTDSADVCVGSSVMFGPQPLVDAGWSWTGPNGYTSTARQIGLANVTAAMSGTYIATFTNAQGSGSHKFTLTVSSVSPSISISAPLNPVCPGSTFTLTASVSNGGSLPSLTWYRNGVATNATGNTYSFAFNNGDVVYSIMNSGGVLPACLSSNTATSNTLTLATSPAACPVITPYTSINNGPWQQTDSVQVCVGGIVFFGPQPNVDNGWIWTGPNGYVSNSREIRLYDLTTDMSGIYQAAYTNPQGDTGYKTFKLNVAPQGQAPCNLTAIASPTSGGLKDYIHAYPNPASEYLEISTNKEGEWKAILIDAKGSELSTIYVTGGQGKKMWLTGLQSGLYILKMQSNSEIYMEKVMIIK